MARYSILTFQKKLDKAEWPLAKIGYPRIRHDVNDVVFLDYGSEDDMKANIEKARLLLGWAVPVTVMGGDIDV